MENHALDIIDMLYNMIAEAWGVPLGNDKCIVERDKALNLLDDLKATLPMELSEARRLVNARDEFVANAKQEAENIRSSAQKEAAEMLDKENVYNEAKSRAEAKLKETEEKCRATERAAGAFLDDALRQTEEGIAKALEEVRQKRTQFRAAYAPEPEGTADVTLQDVEDSDFLGQ